MNMDFKRKLPIPKEVKDLYPVTPAMEQVKAQRDAEIKAIFTGQSARFLLIIGPCSADHRESVLDYIGRLRLLQDQVQDKIVIIPRVYTNKPRTTGDGYMGMLHQPRPGEAPDMLEGIITIRDLYMTALRDYGFTCADELLYPENYRYMSDLLAYAAVGARSVENQQHRLTASGLDIPVGMKNPTSGDMRIMINAVNAAQHGHTFLYRGWEVTSTGNPLAHTILRGYTDPSGRCAPNYGPEHLRRLQELYQAYDLQNPSVIIDTNHANSGKQPLEQVRIAREMAALRRQDGEWQRLIKGLMIESYIEDGFQAENGNTYGQSITDPCLGWEKTRRLVLELAETL